ncbi:unnamed protein product [Zymoseptoria tritici ST99CH_3D1]|nr:unnamed protein product [Zymoseptoria tritici ST99CH_3D1]
MRKRQLSAGLLQQADEISYSAQDISSVLNIDGNINEQSNSLDRWDSAAWDSMLPFPPFFEQIMAPDFVASQSQAIPDIFSLMPDQDWLSEGTDIFGVDFTPTIDQAIQSRVGHLPLPTAQGEHTEPDMPRPKDNAKERFAMFERSPWLWKPEANSNAFSEHEVLPLDERQVDMAKSPHQRFLPALALPDELSSQSRDRIFQLVLKTAKSQVKIPTFPSTTCLNMLLKVGLAKRMEVDPWIHPYTFNSETSRTELLVALIAAGCICFGIPSVSKTGLILFEIARVALHRLAEEDNSVIRDLQYLQAYMLWVEVTAFCGFKRKMEIGEHSLQPLVTGLRRAGKLDRAAYTRIEPMADDDEQVLKSKWEAWIEAESYKRLVHHLFDHDMYTTHAKFRNPLISYAEVSLPLPACRDLWLARSAETWRSAFFSVSPQANSEPLALRDLLADCHLLKCLPKCFDARLARNAQLCGLAAQTWEYDQQSTMLGSKHAGSNLEAQLYLQLQHKRLYQSLEEARRALKEDLTVTLLLSEFLMMSLHANIDTIARFAVCYTVDLQHKLKVDSKQARNTKTMYYSTTTTTSKGPLLYIWALGARAYG